MSKTTIILVAVAVSVLIAAAEPLGLRIGPRLTYNPYTSVESYYSSDDTLGLHPLNLVTDRRYISAGLEAEYGPLLLFRLRAEIAQARVYTSGGMDVTLFPVGGDIMVEPPVRWRLLPYAYFGGELVPFSFGGSALEDSTTVVASPGRHLRAGIGGRFALTPRIDLFAEVQAYSDDLSLLHPDFGAGFFGFSRTEATLVGFAKAHAGVRFLLAN
jgi:hypothetical protein